MAQSARVVFVYLLFLLTLGSLMSQAQAREGTSSPAIKKAAAKTVSSRNAKPAAARSKKPPPVRSAKAAPQHKAASPSKTAKLARQPVAAVPALASAGELAGLHMTSDPLALKSNVALVVDQETSEILFEKNADVALPMASITKLMTSLVVLEANQDMDEMLEVTKDDIDREKFTGSRLRIGSRLSRADMLHIALMSSENRAASALGRNYPGGLPAFVKAMNAKARQLGMAQTRYVDSTGLSSGNVASAQDLARLVAAAHQHALIRYYSTDVEYTVAPGKGMLHYRSSNALIRKPEWEISLQKTGYISEAGRCLVMHAKVEGHPVVMVFLDAKGSASRLADAGKVRNWLSTTRQPILTSTELAAKG